MPKVSIIQPDPVCPAAIIQAALHSRGIETETVRTFAEVEIPEGPPDDGLLILGGAQSLLDEDQRAFTNALARRIREHTTDKRPVLGICLGAQLIGAAYGATISRAPELQFGFCRLRKLPNCEGDSLVGDIDDGQVVFTWHEDQTSVPDDGVPLISSDQVGNYGFRVGKATYGFQCHFEVTEAVIKKMLDRGRHLVPKNLGIRGEKLAREIDHEVPKHIPSASAFGKRVAARWADLVVRRARGHA